jgi:trimeric autotransporter adhesin
MNPGGAGDLIITIGGDLSALEAALAQIPQLAQEAFAPIEAAVNAVNFDGLSQGAQQASTAIDDMATATAASATSVDDLSTVMGQAATEAEATAASADTVGSSLQTAGESAAGAATQLAEVGAASNETAAAFTELIGEIGGGILTFEGLKEVLVESTQAFADEQKAIFALGAILKDQSGAEEAIDAAKQLADQLGIAQESAVQAQQKLAALGESLTAIPQDMTAIADGAAAMNTSFDTASQRFDQIINSGTLMARSLTTIGLNAQDVGAAMGMAGVPLTVLTQSFKELDVQTRANIIDMAELTKNAGDAATAAQGVAGAWNQVKNALSEAYEEIGKQLNGFQGLASTITFTIQIVESAFTGFTGTVKIAVDAVIALFQTLVTPLVAVGQVINDALTGNLKDVPADITAANGAIEDALKSGLTNIQTDFQTSGDAMQTIWQTAMTGVATSTTQAGTAIQAQAGSINVLQLAAQKAQKDFSAVAAAFDAGRVSSTAYTAALNALNTAQENANGGFELAATAALSAANAYRLASVAAANAQTDLNAIGAAAVAGTASWTQYDAALKQLVTDEENANSGLLSLHTAMLVQAEDFQNLGVAEENAETNFAAVQNLMLSGAASVQQYTAALEAMNTAQMNLNGGLQDFNTAVLLAENSFRQEQVTATNAVTVLQALRAAYDAGTVGVNQLIDATNAYVKAQLAANGGVQTWQTAQAQLAASQAQLTVDLQNANTVLGQAQQMYENGSISLGVLEHATKAQADAQNALNGVTASAANISKGAATAQDGLANAFTTAKNAANGLATSVQATNDSMTAGQVAANNFATGLQYINGQWVNLGHAAVDATNSTNQFATGLSMVNGQFVQIGTAAVSATDTGLNPFATELQVINGQFVTLTGNAGAAASAISSVGAAAQSAASAVGSLGSELDQSMNASIGNQSVNLSTGQSYQQFMSSTRISEGSLGDSSGTGIGNPAAGENPFNTMTTIMGGFSVAAGSATTALNAVTTAATASATATTASATMAAALQQVTDANILEQQAAQASGTAAYTSLKAVADAAAQAAAAALASAEGITASANATTVATSATTASAAALANFGATVTNTAGMSAEALNALNSASAAASTSLTTATTALASSSTALSQGVMLATGAVLDFGASVGAMAQQVQQSTAQMAPAGSQPYISNGGALMPIIGPPGSYTTPTIAGGATGTVGGPGGATAPATPTTYQISLFNNGVVAGQGGLQQLSQMVGQQIVQVLNSKGVRLNRQ